MTDVNLSALDLTVFGGPTRVDVDVDFGPQGQRGSRINAITADPRLSTTVKPFDSIVGDLLLNVTPSASDYLMLYQKVGTASEDWQEIVELFPNIYSNKVNLNFQSGIASYQVILNNVFTITDQNYNVSRFTVQHNIENANPSAANLPVASGASLAVSASGGNQVLTITLNAIEYNSALLPQNPWQSVDGTRAVHFFVTAI